MTAIRGDFTAFMGAIGSREGDDSLGRAIAVAGSTFETDTFTEGESQILYLVFADQGVEILLRDGVVAAVFVCGTKNDELDAYPNPKSLIDGLDFTSTRDQVTALLGDPHRSTDCYELYRTEDCFVHFEFAADRLAMVTAMLHDPAVD